MHNLTADHKPLQKSDWDAAKAATIATVSVLDAVTAEDIQQALKPDLRAVGGSRGRALQKIVGAHLLRGDRLERVDGNPDSCCDIRCLALPAKLHFFRPHRDSRLTFHMPFLFPDADHGPAILSPRNRLGDILHTMDGGVCQYAGGSNFKLLLVRAEYVFGVAAHASQHVMQHRAMLHVNRELHHWYLTP